MYIHIYTNMYNIGIRIIYEYKKIFDGIYVYILINIYKK